MRLYGTHAGRVAWRAAATMKLGSILFLAALAAEAQVSVTEVRHWSVGDVTRIAVETDGEFRYKYERLSEPDRIYFDILNSRQRVSSTNDYAIEVNGPLVERVRVAQNRRNTVRVVLYLSDRLDVQVSRLANPDRLMLEVRGDGSASNTGVAPTPRQVPVEKPPAIVEQAVAAVTPEMQAPVSPEPVGVPVKEEEPEPLIAAPAQQNQSGGQSLTRVLGLKLGRIVIDPGHGGRDTGTIGSTGLREKDVTLDVARHLARLVEDGMDSEVVLTREGDDTVRLSSRGEIANEARADLFLSIHVNSYRNPSVAGTETFYLNFTSSRADMEVAARENAGSDKSLHELSDLVRKITLDDRIQESRDFASSIQMAVHNLAKTQDPSVRNRGVKKAPFVVLIGAGMPAALVELGFISNPEDEKLLSDPDHRRQLAEALYKGLASYASTLSHFQVAQTGSD